MKKKRSTEDVTLNVTAMLDMAFQLLAFFVLTFRPPPGEEQIFLKLPPAKPVTGFTGTQNAGADDTKDAKDVKTTRSVVVQLQDANGDGSISKVYIGDPSIGKLKEIAMNTLPDELRHFFRAKDPGDAGDQKGGAIGNYEQMVIQSTPTLRWEEVLKVADKCTGLSTIEEDKMPAISFSCMKPETNSD